MSNFAVISRSSEFALYVGAEEDVVPEGHFTAQALIVGIPTIYLLAGNQHDDNAPIVGRIELKGTQFTAYKGTGLKGGGYQGQVPAGEFAEAFEQMV